MKKLQNKNNNYPYKNIDIAQQDLQLPEQPIDIHRNITNKLDIQQYPYNQKINQSPKKSTNNTNFNTNLISNNYTNTTANTNNRMSMNNSRKIQNKQLLNFNINPVIVTRRNVSTAQNKKQNNNQDQQDLLLTTNQIHKKQQISKSTKNTNKNTNYGSHFGQTVRQSFKKSNERPQSKQQPRTKGWTNSQILIKSTVLQTHRPQTSKGQRPKNGIKSVNSQVSSKRKTSLGNQQTKKINDEIISINKNEVKASKIFFKTSIDTEFLSLFAN